MRFTESNVRKGLGRFEVSGLIAGLGDGGFVFEGLPISGGRGFVPSETSGWIYLRERDESYPHCDDGGAEAPMAFIHKGQGGYKVNLLYTHLKFPGDSHNRLREYLKAA
jgi:hypothetical protein